MRGPSLPFLVVIAVVAAAHLSLAPGIADADAFYHLGHAAQYAAAGPLDTSFPWATQSVIGDLGGDLWWGFHVILIPFAALFGVVGGMRAAAVVLTVTLAASVGWLLHRHRVAGAAWWTALFLVAVPNVLYRYLMVRPHVLSLALALLLLSFLIRGRWWQVLLAAAAITWLHLSLFWMAPGIVAAWALARLVTGARRREPADPGVDIGVGVAAVATGTLLGAVLRPHPLATWDLAWVQIVRLFAEKATDRPLIFATELLPLPVAELARTAWSLLLVWLAALAAAWWWRRGAAEGEGSLPRPERLLLLTSGLIATAFLALTVFSARRALVEWTAFAFLALPLVWCHVVPSSARRRVLPALVLLLTIHTAWGAQRHLLNARLVAFPPDAMAEVATFLEREAQPGDTVFHAHWDNFGPLFAHDRTRRYVGGMDPIFQFAHDPGRYWEHFFLSADLTQEYTCDAWPCFEGTATPTWEAIRRHFGARWVVVEPARNPKLTLHLLDDPHFALALETRHEAVFRIVEPAPPDTE